MPELMPEAALTGYADALTAKDMTSVLAIFSRRSLLELPMMKPGRLVGLREIEDAHQAIFRSLESIEIKLGDTAADASHAIATGTVSITRTSGEQRTDELAIVAETGDTGLDRISLYMDARNARAWSDIKVV